MSEDRPASAGLVGDGPATVVSYERPGMAEDYRTWDDAACWVLGYPFVPVELGLGPATGGRLLDLGCGPGDFTRWLVERYPVRTVAVDASPSMLELARRYNAHPSVEYRLGVEDRMPFLPDACVDAAVCCFVFPGVSDRQRLDGLVAEVARVVRPEGHFTVLVPHPHHADGVPFEGFLRGERGACYADGDPLPVRVRRRDGTCAQITNTYWSMNAYRSALSRAGFTGIRERSPVLADADGVADPALLTARPWRRERTTPPFLLLTAQRG
ncbi:class I SAM-dependent methyltransferase [Streptomyces sp. NPDC026206]|uniref:class I SAM-dependent methyltransferase n=1 Tax=Streptomyces sp. NPDC026206 TaxID=3157089 RepID=UPI0033C1C359